MQEELKLFQRIDSNTYESLTPKKCGNPKKKSPLTKQLLKLNVGDGLLVHKKAVSGKRPQYYGIAKAYNRKFTMKTCRDGNYFAILRIK